VKPIYKITHPLLPSGPNVVRMSLPRYEDVITFCTRIPVVTVMWRELWR